MNALVRHRGGCHCGTVTFEVEAPADLVAQSCNCSMCRMCGFVHLIVPAAQFHPLSGEDALTCYRFNTGTAQHWFCKHCGIKSFYIPRSNPDGFSVNVNCLDPGTINSLRIDPFDGQNWEQNAAELEHLSSPSD